MINLTDIMYRIRVRVPDGAIFNLSQALVDNCNLEGNENEVSERISFVIKNEKVDSDWIHKLLYVGNYVYVHATVGDGWVEVFRGRIYEWIYGAKKDQLTIVAYDLNFRYQSSEVNIYRQRNETGASLTKRLIARWRNRTIKQLDGPNTSLPSKAYDKKLTVTEIISDSIKESKEKGDGNYVIRCIDGEIAIIKEGTNKDVYELNEFLEDIEDHHSIKDLVTRVRIYRTNDKNVNAKAKLERTIDGKTEYGVLQRLVYTDGKSLSDGIKEAETILKDQGEVKKTRKITHPDVPFIKKGDAILLNGGTVGTSKKPAKLIVKSINHDIKNLSMRITVE